MDEVRLKPGKYIVAVSGGVDSVVLLDALRNMPGVEIIVAHADHGIRSDSKADADLVRQLAVKYGLPFELSELRLNPRTSESVAREKRYEWLESIRAKHGAVSIVTAHHQNDVIETILINILRGTGWRGLASLRSTYSVQRPLLNVPKIDIVTYAINHGLKWHEDSTNDDVRYLRNYVRHGIMPRLSQAAIAQFVSLYHNQLELRDAIETEVSELAPRAAIDKGMSRYWLIMVPDNAARELLRTKYGSLTYDQFIRLLHFARSAKSGAYLELGSGQMFCVTARQLISLEG